MINTLSMKALPLIGHAKKFAGISIIATAVLGASSCISRSEKEFKEQHGFKRSDYFGKRNSKYVPSAAKGHTPPDRYQEGDASASGLPIK